MSIMLDLVDEALYYKVALSVKMFVILVRYLAI